VTQTFYLSYFATAEIKPFFFSYISNMRAPLIQVTIETDIHGWPQRIVSVPTYNLYRLWSSCLLGKKHLLQRLGE